MQSFVPSERIPNRKSGEATEVAEVKSGSQW